MKTQGEIEAAICDGMTRFEQEYMGRGPKDIHAHLIGDLLVVRLQGVLTAAEQQLVKSLPVAKGRDLLKEVRTQLIETARPLLEVLVENITGIKALSLHHDISTVTGEELVLFTLAMRTDRPRNKKEINSIQVLPLAATMEEREKSMNTALFNLFFAALWTVTILFLWFGPDLGFEDVKKLPNREMMMMLAGMLLIWNVRCWLMARSKAAQQRSLEEFEDLRYRPLARRLPRDEPEVVNPEFRFEDAPPHEEHH